MNNEDEEHDDHQLDVHSNISITHSTHNEEEEEEEIHIGNNEEEEIHIDSDDDHHNNEEDETPIEKLPSNATIQLENNTRMELNLNQLGSNLSSLSDAELEGSELDDSEEEKLGLVRTVYHHHYEYEGDKMSAVRTDNVYKTTGIDLDDMLINLEDKAFKKKTLKDLLLYIPFMVLVILWLTFSTQIKDAYWMNVGLKDLFL
jgi:hypothetical protein